MRIAISNIAWDPTEDNKIASLLQKYAINAIDIAPGKYFSQPLTATEQEVNQVKTAWSDRGVEITGMQALLFGTTGLNLFGSAEIQDKMLEYLSAICRIGSGLEGKRLVFGSPQQRNRAGLSDERTLEVAIPFFQRLGNIAQSHGVMICLEPNPSCYGANFMTTSSETAEIVKHVDHPSIKMQLDTGAISINNEDITHILQEHSSLIGHIHISEPKLLPLGDGQCQHEIIASALKEYLPNHLASIEMLATTNENHEISIERALKIALHNYSGVL